MPLIMHEEIAPRPWNQQAHTISLKFLIRMHFIFREGGLTPDNRIKTAPEVTNGLLFTAVEMCSIYIYIVLHAVV